MQKAQHKLQSKPSEAVPAQVFVTPPDVHAERSASPSPTSKQPLDLGVSREERGHHHHRRHSAARLHLQVPKMDTREEQLIAEDREVARRESMRRDQLFLPGLRKPASRRSSCVEKRGEEKPAGKEEESQGEFVIGRRTSGFAGLPAKPAKSEEEEFSIDRRSSGFAGLPAKPPAKSEEQEVEEICRLNSKRKAVCAGIKPAKPIQLEDEDALQQKDSTASGKRSSLFGAKAESLKSLISEGASSIKERIGDTATSMRKSLAESAESIQSLLSDIDARTLRLLFWRYSGMDGTISRARLPVTLKVLGYSESKITPKAIDGFANEIIGDAQTMNYHAFEQFCSRVDDDHTHGAMKSFHEADLDGNGVLNAPEVTLVLEHHDITVLPGVVMEIIEEVGLTQPGVVNMTEFEMLLNIIRCRSGFTKTETKHYLSLFKRYDNDGNEKIDRGELLSILTWLGLCKTDEQRRQLVDDSLRELDSQHNGEVVEPEFLHLMRKFREREIEEISELFSKHDFSGSGEMDLDGFVDVLREMGFLTACGDVVSECSVRAGIRKKKDEDFFFDDVLTIIPVFRECEGFSRQELDEFTEVFTSNDSDGSGAVDAVELGSILRWLGQPADVETTQDLMEEVDIDKSGQVDFDEFLRVMRRFREDELTRIETLFMAADEDRSGRLDLQEIKYMLLGLGYKPTKEHNDLLQEKFAKTDATLADCIEFVAVCREECRKVFRQNQGFSKKELSRFSKPFRKEMSRMSVASVTSRTSSWSQIPQSVKSSSNPEDSWFMGSERLGDVVSELFPEAMKDCGEEVDQIVLKFSGSDKDIVTWMDFLRLARMVVDRAENYAFDRQQAAAEEAGFNNAQFMEIRKLFKLVDLDNSKEVSFSELKELFAKVIPDFTEDMAQKLMEQWQASDQDGDGQLDFCEFVKMMRCVVDAGLAGDILGEEADQGEVWVPSDGEVSEDTEDSD